MSSQYGLNRLGYTGATMVTTKSSNNANWCKSQKNYLSSDCPLQLEGMKAESLVIVKQHATVNLWPNLVHTARQTMEIGLSKRGWFFCLKSVLILYLFFYSNIFHLDGKLINFLRLSWRLGLSRNRVDVGEPAAGFNFLFIIFLFSNYNGDFLFYF